MIKVKFFILCFLLPSFLVYGQETTNDELLHKIEQLTKRIEIIESTLDLDVSGNGVQESPNLWREDPNLIIDSQECGEKRLDKKYFEVCYNTSWKIAKWVGYYLDRNNLVGAENRKDNFRIDEELEEDERSLLTDYKGSGYDRGHMAPAASFKRTEDAMSTTFLLSNMAPQTPHLNRRSWAYLENAVRSLVSGGGRVWVFTGNIVDENGKKLKSRVSIPSHCFKAILYVDGEGDAKMYGFILPNDKAGIGDFLDYMVSIDQIEQETGIELFSVLPDPLEDRVEKEVISWPSIK